MSSTSSNLLFVGAGASKALKAPSLMELLRPVADYALLGLANESRAGGNIAHYLKTAHGIDRCDLEAIRDRRSFGLPSIVEILTTLDLAISDNSSFGPSRPAAPFQQKEYRGERLRRVQRAMVGAIAGHIAGATEHVQDEDAVAALEDYRRLVDAFADSTIVTTNWDTVIDRLLWGVDPNAPTAWRPGARRVRYSPIAEEIVDYAGDKVDWSQHQPSSQTTFLKLHGSLNWLCCPRCNRLMINPTLSLGVETGAPGEGGRKWLDATCWCKAEADALIVTPSYSKDYDNLQLRVIWREALDALAAASEWTFVGYSLPSDDFSVQGLIARALAWKRAQGLPLTSVKVYAYAKPPFQEQAEEAARRNEWPGADAPPEVREFVEVAARFRSTLGDFRNVLDVKASGLAGAAAALS